MSPDEQERIWSGAYNQFLCHSAGNSVLNQIAERRLSHNKFKDITIPYCCCTVCYYIYIHTYIHIVHYVGCTIVYKTGWN